MAFFQSITLISSSLLLFFVGIMRLSKPISTYGNNSGIKIPSDTDLLNEVRGISTLMLCGGILICLGIFIDQLTMTSHVVASLIFLGFALGRILSMMLDGKPNSKIIQGLMGTSNNSFWNFNAGIFSSYKKPKTEFSHS